MEKEKTEDKLSENTGNDPDRNKCPLSLCHFETKTDEATGSSWQECIRCGRKKDLNYRV